MPRITNPTGFDDIDGLPSELTDGLSRAFARLLGSASENPKTAICLLHEHSHATAPFRHSEDD
ncbi:MAG: hypothetical protein ABIR62_17075 [Dokdonella sp.]|uniref:hypothetical protein n=1 Tax=Dokdonella sp. TaxID=2291710 RepID=UPI003267E480